MILKKISSSLIFFFISVSCFSQGNKNKYENNNIEQRIYGIISKMTLDEKLDYIGGYEEFCIRPIKRLGLPQIRTSDGPVGVSVLKKVTKKGERIFYNSTAYPAGIASAASWDTALVNKLGHALGKDAHASAVQILLAPGVNIVRAPMCGRNFEYYGEDPYLTSQMAVSYIKGLQSENIIATVKHYVANNQEYNRHYISSNIDERTLHEIYLPAFKAAVKADVATVMTSYNLYNGSWTSESPYLINDILKDKWGFKGFVMSDWGAVHNGVLAANAGLDLEMGGGFHMNRDVLTKAIDDGVVTIATIDDKVRRILRVLIQYGFLDKKLNKKNNAFDNREHAKLALEIAENSMVLLKNDKNILPLDRKKINKIAVIGPNSEGFIAGGGSSTTYPFHTVSFYNGIKVLAGNQISVSTDPGLSKLSEKALNLPFYTARGSTKIGLTGEYFPNQTLKGKPQYVSIDENIDFKWESNSPVVKGFPTDSCSMRWTGVVRPQKTGSYLFSLNGDNGYRFYINDKMIINSWGLHNTLRETIAMSLNEGEEYNIKIEYTKNVWDGVLGFNWGENSTITESALKLAKESDVVILCMGFNSKTEGEGVDRTFKLPANQDALIKAITNVNPNAIVVLSGGGNVDMNDWINDTKGLIHAWYAGQEGGTALAKILFGDVNPNGKLPVSFEKKREDNPTYSSYYDENDSKEVTYSEGLFIGYRYYDTKSVQTRFPFGFGLSYTTFDYSNLKIDSKTNKDSVEINVSFNITNTGDLDGAEVAQLYVHQNACPVVRPLKELKGFSKVFLKAGETKTVKIKLDENAISYYKESIHDFGYDNSSFDILIGAASKDIRLNGTFITNNKE